MKVKVSRSEDIDSQYTDVEITDCTAVEALTIIEAIFNPVVDDEPSVELLH